MDIKDFSRDELIEELKRKEKILSKVLSNKIEPFGKQNFDIDGLYEFFNDHLKTLIEDVIDTNARSLNEIDDGSIEFKEDLYYFVLDQIYGSNRFYDYIDEICKTLKEKD